MGGGYRGIYAAGVLDYCMDQNLQFDLGIGVSAGSCNLISYAAHQPRRNLQFYSEYGRRKESAGAWNFFHKNTFLDLDYLYSTLSNSDGEAPLDYPTFAASPMDYYAVAVDAQTGETRYFEKQDIVQDDYSPLKASCAMPFFCHPYEVKGRPYYDGALGDPIPVQKAMELGCDKVIVLLSKPRNFRRTPDRDIRLAALIGKDYPKAAEKLRRRAELYNQELGLAHLYERQGRALIVAPEDTCGVDTLTRDPETLIQFYEKGYGDGIKIQEFLETC